MGLSQSDSLGDLFSTGGHVYAVGLYVQIHFYTTDEGIARRIATFLDARVCISKGVFDVCVTNKKGVGAVAKKLLTYSSVSDELRGRLRLASMYAALPRGERTVRSEILQRLKVGKSDSTSSES